MAIEDYAPQPALVFGGVEIYGIVERFPLPPPELQVYRTHFTGLNGVSELTGGIGGRTLEIQIVLCSSYASKTALQAFYNAELNRDLSNVNDVLTYHYFDGEEEKQQEFFDCTFQGFFEDPRHGPLPDDAGTLDGGWWIRGVLVFRQNNVHGAE